MLYKSRSIFSVRYLKKITRTWYTKKIREFQRGYFLGSIICISDSKDVLEVSPLEVIDGQQRLTTICILLAALYKEMSGFKKQMSEDNLTKYINVKDHILHEGAAEDIILRPQEQNSNRLDFYYMLKEAGIKPTATKVPYYPLRAISRCYRFFCEQIENDLAESEDPVAKLLDIEKKILTANFVKIEVDSHSDAYVMFESLNNRGASLTAVDLMKNAALARAERSGLDVDECYETWQEILGCISGDYKAQERFFRFYYNAFRKELNDSVGITSTGKTYPLGDIATRSNLLSIYIELMDHDLPGFLENLMPAAEIYGQLLTPESSETPFKEDFANLNHIQGISGYIILLYLLRFKEELLVTDAIIRDVTGLLVRFFVRRNMTDMPPTRDLNRMMIEILTSVRSKQLKGRDILAEIRSVLISRSAPDAVFQEKLSGDIYLINYDATRYILCSFVEEGMTLENHQDMWAQEKVGSRMQNVWTIEHILPEGENLPKEWVEMIAEGDRQKATDIQAKWCHKLGNLTLTRYNSTLGNRSFEYKRDRTDSEGHYVGYRNGLNINADLADKDSWKRENIERRTSEFISKALDKFKL